MAGRARVAGLEAGRQHAGEECCAETRICTCTKKLLQNSGGIIVDFQAEKASVGRDLNCLTCWEVRKTPQCDPVSKAQRRSASAPHHGRTRSVLGCAQLSAQSSWLRAPWELGNDKAANARPAAQRGLSETPTPTPEVLGCGHASCAPVT